MSEMCILKTKMCIDITSNFSQARSPLPDEGSQTIRSYF